jgi:glycosyltransferase involved in cell wall biosynthesis
MRIGLIARADKTGLAIQTHLLYRLLEPSAVLLVDFQRYGFIPDVGLYSEPANKIHTLRLWPAFNYGRLDPKTCEPTAMVDAFLKEVDVIVSCETFYDMRIVTEAKRLNKRTVLQPNYEFMDWLIDSSLPKPDVFALPTNWHETDIRQQAGKTEVIVLPVPVDPTIIAKRRLVEELKHVVHVAGTVAQTDRAGTKAFIEAMRFVQSDVTATVRAQRPLSNIGPIPDNVQIIDDYQTRTNVELYENADVLVLPRRYGGLCLPMQEALALGIPAIMPDVAPQNAMLHSTMLLPAQTNGIIQTRAKLTLWDVAPEQIAHRIDRLANDKALMSELSLFAREWAYEHSWDVVRWQWDAVLHG